MVDNEQHGTSRPADETEVARAAEAAEEQGLLFSDDVSPLPSDTGYRGPTACNAAGITYRQLDYWARTGLVEPSVRSATGSGSQRLYSFRDMRNAAAEPLLRKLLTYVSRDEARHTGYGVKYLSYVVPTLSDAERAQLEDFAYEAARLLIDSRSGTALRDSVLGIWRSAGLDPVEILPKLMQERASMRDELARSGGRFGPVRGFVIPTLRSIGLFSPRIQKHFEEIFTANFGPAMGDLSQDAVDLPSDLEAWVNEGAEGL